VLVSMGWKADCLNTAIVRVLLYLRFQARKAEPIRGNLFVMNKFRVYPHALKSGSASARRS